jgi:peptidoglycan/LPS O-acetylase OafA/YrhL
MQSYRVDRKQYWIIIAFLLVLKFGIVIAVEFLPDATFLVRYVDTPVVIAFAFVVGARFVDAGWPRWLGITLVVLIMLVLPLIILFASGLQPAGPSPLDALPSMMWLVTVALLVLLVVAGTRPSTPVPLSLRVDPTF